MKVSLNWAKKYIDIPAELTNSQIAYDLTMRTVEVEDVVDTAEKLHDIVVGKITAVNAHPNADKLRVCMVDIGERAGRKMRKSEAKTPPNYVHQKFTKFF